MLKMEGNVSLRMNIIKKCISLYNFKVEKKVTEETLGDRREDFLYAKKRNGKNETRLRKRCTGEKELSSYNFEVRALRRKG